MKGLKTGGRKPQTPNRTTADLRAKINDIVGKQIDNIESDLEALKPLERLQIVEKLISYCVPKMQSLDIQTSLELEYKNLEALLLKADDASLEIITNKILTLKNQSDETN
jgi:ABC-type phosphate transport system auxiliary subunit